MTARYSAYGALGAALLLTTGCASLLNPKPKDISEERGLGPYNSVMIGAASRSINTVEIREDSKPGQVRPKRIVCAEPSPDVATTIAQSITASFNAATKVDNPQGQSIAAQAAGSYGQSSAQGALQLGERLATVTLLRDSLHRACEAYANGALTDMSYSLILSRYHATMVTMLNSELTAGAFGRELGALTSDASHALGGLASDVDAASTALDNAQRDVVTRQSELNTALASNPTNETEAAAKEAHVKNAQGALKTAKDKEFTARADLEAARLKGASGRARVDAINVKGIKADVSPGVGDRLLALTKQFNESGMPEAMLVACITAMDGRHGAAIDGSLPAICAQFMQGLAKGVEDNLMARAQVQRNPELEERRLQSDLRIRLAQISANVVGDIAKLCSSQKTPEDTKACISAVKHVADTQLQESKLPDGADQSFAKLSSFSNGSRQDSPVRQADAVSANISPDHVKAGPRPVSGQPPAVPRVVAATQIPALPPRQ